jgi:FAD/FMN-containing dehydrogenase
MTGSADISALAETFSGRLLTAQDDMAPYLTDWRKLWRGRARAVALPDRPEDVAAILRWCAARRVPVVPQGGNTGLSLGATPDDSGTSLLVCTSRLDRIRHLDTDNATMTVDAGCVLARVQQAAEAAGMFFPLSLAAEGSCTIGGNLATNAGGTGVLRYGNARSLCLGLEVVTADGDIWDGLLGLRKDNSGYDLRDLFIGSEGTLGIITGAVLQLFPRQEQRATALLAVATPERAVSAFRAAREGFGQALSAAEFFSNMCVELVQAHGTGLRAPFGAAHPLYLLLEASDSAEHGALAARMEALLAACLEAGTIEDAIIAQSAAQRGAIWALREGISEAQGAAGPTIKHDIAVPLSALPHFLSEAGQAVTARFPAMRCVTFGHIGDGNVHYNFSPPAGGDDAAFLAQQHALNRCVHDVVLNHGGSISAEHGLGRLRHEEAARTRPAVATAMMRRIKLALDPQNLLNPGKVLPQDGAV